MLDLTTIAEAGLFCNANELEAEAVAIFEAAEAEPEPEVGNAL